jgi:hypothetical protein
MIGTGNRGIMTPAIPLSVNCVIRRTKEWATKFEFSGSYRSRWRAAEIAAFWESVFTTTYVDFRRQLRSLQEENLKEVGFDSIIESYEYAGIEGLVVPTDEDDWFHPDLIEALPAQPIVFWNFGRFSENIAEVQNSVVERVQFETNNYALHNPESKTFDHVIANRLFKNKGTHINKCLSMHNRSLASLSVLQPICGNKFELLRLYELYKQPTARDCPSYFFKYINCMSDLYQQLRVRKVF